MKDINTTQTELALAMYKENVSPSETCLQAILSQIPEQQKLKEGRAVRSPYRWLSLTQLAMFCFVLLLVVPNSSPTKVGTLSGDSSYANDPLYKLNAQMDEFEMRIDKEDFELSQKNYVVPQK